MGLSKLEIDLLGDLSADTHGVWEVFDFVRSHHPEASDSEVFRIGRSLLESWAVRGWLILSATPVYPTSVATLVEALELVDRVGMQATRYFEGAPSIDLSDKARDDVPWLSGGSSVMHMNDPSPVSADPSAGLCDCPCHTGRAVHPIPCSCRP